MRIRRHEVQMQASNEVPHGGMVRIAGGFDKDDDEIARLAERFHENIDSGLALLESGTSPYAHDARPVAGAVVETFDYFDGQTGEHVMAWRIACRPMSH